MIYLICNEYINRGIKTIELRNEFHDTLSFKIDKEQYQLGQYVFVDIINNKSVISHEVTKPDNFLKYYFSGEMSTKELKIIIKEYVDKIKNENIKIILEETVLKNEDFYLYPAAKAIHHAYIGGLATHSINILKLAEFYADTYDLNKDILFAGALLHDYGKVRELEAYGLTYSIEGNLLGHISMCYEEVSNIAINLNINHEKEIIALKHVILSHHGQLAYGSPKEPMTIEAYVLSQLDDVDSKIEVLKKSLSVTQPNKISAPILAFDRRRFMKLEEEKKK